MANDVIEIVENFIKRVRNFELLIGSRASDIMFSFPINKYPYSKTRSLSLVLGEAMTEYEENKNNVRKKTEYAYKCLDYINKAYTYAVVHERESIEQKLRECLKQRETLEKELRKISSAYENLQRDYEGIRKYIQPTKVGDA